MSAIRRDYSLGVKNPSFGIGRNPMTAVDIDSKFGEFGIDTLSQVQPSSHRAQNMENSSAAVSESSSLLHNQNLSFSLFQVDDGYQRAWGDWTRLKDKEFPTQSMRSLVMKITERNLLPGLWIAPFACDKHSEVGIAMREMYICVYMYICIYTLTQY
jgi:hypothetical protein